MKNMEINTNRFGEIKVSERELLTFGEGLPGLEDYRKFVLLEPPDSHPVAWLQSAEEKSVCLPVIYTFRALPGYSFDAADALLAELGGGDPDDILVLSILIIPDDITAMTANLAAPIIVNTKTRKSRQIVLTSSDYPVKYPIFEDMCRQLAEVDE